MLHTSKAMSPQVGPLQAGYDTVIVVGKLGQVMGVQKIVKVIPI